MSNNNQSRHVSVRRSRFCFVSIFLIFLGTILINCIWESDYPTWTKTSLPTDQTRQLDKKAATTAILSKITDPPSKITDRPSKITDPPSKITDRPSKITDRPSNITDRPSNITDRPSNITDRPRKITDPATEITSCANMAKAQINSSYESKSLPSWFSNGYVQELDEVNQPITRPLVKQSSINPTCLKYFRARIKDPKPVYQLCDTIELIIEARGCKNTRLTSGGDYFWAWLKTESLSANQATDGNITDLGTGEYVARFTLMWTGKITPVVAVLGTREEIHFMRDWREKIPARFAYTGIFKRGNITVSTPCHLTPWMDLSYTDVKSNGTTRRVCNFTESVTATPWYCIKPENMPCSAYDYHKGDTVRERKLDIAKKYIQKSAGTKNKMYYIKGIVPNEIQVLGTSPYSRCEPLTSRLPQCKHGLTKNDPTRTSGFYFKNVWVSLICKNNMKIDAKMMIETMQNKTLYFFGDSTLRQWYEYLSNVVLTAETCVGNSRMGRIPHNTPHNISLVFSFHGLPIRGKHTTVAVSDYVANRLDALKAGPGVVIVISVWAHFTASTLDFYLQRLLSIKKGIVQLMDRYPGTKVFIKSANTREMASYFTNNWYAWECDLLMRTVLGETPGITIIDVWDMTMGHKTGFHIHPKEVVVKNEVAMMLSYLTDSVDINNDNNNNSNNNKT